MNYIISYKTKSTAGEQSISKRVLGLEIIEITLVTSYPIIPSLQNIASKIVIFIINDLLGLTIH